MSASIGPIPSMTFACKPPGNESREFDCIAHRVADIDQWAQSLRQRFGGPIAVALELAKGPIVYALQKYDFLVLFPDQPVDPGQVP